MLSYMQPSWTDSYAHHGVSGRLTPVVQNLLMIQCVVFALQLILQSTSHPLESLFALSPIGIRNGHLWQFMTYMFLHGGFFDLLFNLIALYFFGMEVERTLGSRRFLTVYLLGGLTGGLLWFVFNTHQINPMLGAYGAVYAVMIAFATLYPNRMITLLVFFVLPVSMLAKYLAIGLVAFSVLLSMSGEGNMGHLSHLGGAVAGYLFIQWMTMESGVKISLPRIFGKKNSKTGSSLKIFKPSVLQKEEFIQERIDPILDKIAAHGIQSLSSEERRILDEAKDRLS